VFLFDAETMKQLEATLPIVQPELLSTRFKTNFAGLIISNYRKRVSKGLLVLDAGEFIDRFTRHPMSGTSDLAIRIIQDPLLLHPGFRQS